MQSISSVPGPIGSSGGGGGGAGVGGGEDIEDDSAVLFQCLLLEAIRSGSGMDRDVHTLYKCNVHDEHNPQMPRHRLCPHVLFNSAQLLRTVSECCQAIPVLIRVILVHRKNPRPYSLTQSHTTPSPPPLPRTPPPQSPFTQCGLTPQPAHSFSDCFRPLFFISSFEIELLRPCPIVTIHSAVTGETEARGEGRRL